MLGAQDYESCIQYSAIDRGELVSGEDMGFGEGPGMGSGRGVEKCLRGAGGEHQKGSRPHC